MTVTSDTRCPCGTGLSYGECCEPFHLGRTAPPTAERMMRSRYSAYVTEDREYLLTTWHPSTRPAALVFEPELKWLRLELMGRTGGGMLDTEGTVEFRAHFTRDGVRQDQHENSTFVRVGKTWRYLGKVEESDTVLDPGTFLA